MKGAEKPDNIPEKLSKPYDPSATEDRIYARWEESGCFNPDTCIEKGVTDADAEPFSMVLPPPNLTGELHLGSALMIAIEDIVTRYKRMQGYRTLWLPGTDHAAIATQSKVEKQIYKEEGVNRHDLGKEEFLKRVDDFTENTGAGIKNQIRKLGASLDWSREAFTLDDKRAFAVRTAFKNMYDAGLIYRGNRIVNWDPKGQTTVSDDEVIHTEETGKIYTFYYSKDLPIPIATTRPETKVGDTAIAVHPEDARYKDYIGKEFDVDFIGVPLHLKIVADEAIDPEFGTGAVGVTPAHSQTDWEIAERHDLPVKQVIDEKTRMTVEHPDLTGKKTKEAREIIVERLKEAGLLEEEKEVLQNISRAERTNGVIEPLPKLQWFVSVNKPFKLPHSKIDGIKDGEEVTLKQLMRAVVENEQIDILPDRFKKTYFHWIDKLNDWCISRQIWYGHQVPVWYCGTTRENPNSETLNPKQITSSKSQTAKQYECEPIVNVKEPETCPRCGGEVKQDSDTLDTWFSSALWTFSTLGWPEETEDLKTYHPTTLLETGHDIIFFWVARMILMSAFHLGEVPFHTVYMHGIVRNEKGEKLSKSLANAGDPLLMIDKYGTDALRVALIIGNGPGNDLKISEDKFKAHKRFANKIWNATRFILSNLSADFDPKTDLKKSESDQRHLDRLDELTDEVAADFDNYRLYLAAEKLYQYFWHEFADVIIEESKPILNGEDEEAKLSRQHTLYTILQNCIKMLHPFMPYITEELWSILPKNDGRLLMVERWPK